MLLGYNFKMIFFDFLIYTFMIQTVNFKLENTKKCIFHLFCFLFLKKTKK